MTERSAAELFTKHDADADPGCYAAEAAGLASLAAAGAARRPWCPCARCTPTTWCWSGCTRSG